VPAANELALQADVILAVGTRLGDFCTASHTLFPQAKVVGLNLAAFDAHKWWSVPLQADARLGLEALGAGLPGWKADPAWTEQARQLCAAWQQAVLRITSKRDAPVPYDGEVIGAVQRWEKSATDDTVVTVGGTLPNCRLPRSFVIPRHLSVGLAHRPAIASGGGGRGSERAENFPTARNCPFDQSARLSTRTMCPSTPPA
jgi:TPP-dependent trihydroxycyclohexane-1,2-dione (THcHDO) dehydratase